MNGRTRKVWYMRISKRDGEFCHACEKLPSQGQLVVDHIDNNNCNNSFDNLQLLCRTCNYKKNPRGEPVDQCVSFRSDTKMKSSISINKEKELKFREWVYDGLDERKKLPYHDVINSGAEYIGISIITAKRYLIKMLSGHGNLKQFPELGWGIGIAYKDNVTRFS
jgi:hypothetical protein